LGILTRKSTPKYTQVTSVVLLRRKIPTRYSSRNYLSAGVRLAHFLMTLGTDLNPDGPDPGHNLPLLTLNLAQLTLTTKIDRNQRIITMRMRHGNVAKHYFCGRIFRLRRL